MTKLKMREGYINCRLHLEKCDRTSVKSTFDDLIFDVDQDSVQRYLINGWTLRTVFVPLDSMVDIAKRLDAAKARLEFKQLPADQKRISNCNGPVSQPGFHHSRPRRPSTWPGAFFPV